MVVVPNRAARNDQSDVQVGRGEPGQRLHAHVGELVVALHRHQRAGGQGEEADNDGGATNTANAPAPMLIWAISRTISVL